MMRPIRQVSQYRNAFLNRQFVILLVDLGVPPAVFIELFYAQANRIVHLPERVKENKIETSVLQIIDRVSAFPIRELIDAGYGSDLVMQDVLSVIERRMLSELRWNARIEISEGVYAFGKLSITGLCNPFRVLH